jgi:Protein of unknown function (DUF1579)
MRITAAIVLTLAGVVGAQEAPKPPTPQKEHEWLKQLAGEWVTKGEGVLAPGQPPIKCRGTESTKVLGDLWAVSELKGEVMGTAVTGLMTLGYDTKKKQFVGTWVCSMHDSICRYEGRLDGSVLTLETEGPHPAAGKAVKMRDVIEVKGKDHKVITSLVQGEEGKWVTFMTMHARRKN